MPKEDSGESSKRRQENTEILRGRNRKSNQQREKFQLQINSRGEKKSTLAQRVEYERR